MALYRAEKYVSSLPSSLTANTVYFVKNGAGIDIYVTNDTGTIVAYPINTSSSVSIPYQQIPYGTGGGITSDPKFIFNGNQIQINSAANPGIRFKDPGGSFDYLFYAGANNIGAGFYNYLTNTDVFTLYNNNVGIKNIAPTESLDVTGNIKSSGLAGTGTRMVVANSSGVMSTQAIPSAGTPGGSTTQVQYNNAGAFEGASKVRIQADGNLSLVELGYLNNPSNPAISQIAVYAKSIAGIQRLTVIGSGDTLDKPLQNYIGSVHSGSIVNGLGGTANGWSAGTGLFLSGMQNAASATVSNASISATNLLTTSCRSTSTSSATAGNFAGGYPINARFPFYRGVNAYGGGFQIVIKFGASIFPSTARCMIGLFSTAPTNVEPSNFLNCIFLGKDTTDTNLQWMVNDASGVCTKSDLGYALDTSAVYELHIACKPNTNTISTVLINTTYATRTYISQTSHSSNLPVATTFMAPYLYISNGTTASSVAFDFISMYAEMDF